MIPEMYYWPERRITRVCEVELSTVMLRFKWQLHLVPFTRLLEMQGARCHGKIDSPVLSANGNGGGWGTANWPWVHQSPSCDFLLSPKVVRYLVERGANVETPNRHEHTCLMIACFRGHENIVKYLLSRGARVNRRSAKGGLCFR